MAFSMYKQKLHIQAIRSASGTLSQVHLQLSAPSLFRAEPSVNMLERFFFNAYFVVVHAAVVICLCKPVSPIRRKFVCVCVCVCVCYQLACWK